ncbi:hypothetical protein LTR29_018122 [Friedmanniomyces endolithicus]|nr:hypothetical protein LTR29_018122 [Friedmanniomyces endolithicus]
MGSIAKTQSELTLARMNKLNSVRSELLECPPMAGDSGADQKNLNLIRRLCHSSLKDEDAPRLVDAVKALRRCSEVAGDERNLFRCLENLLVMVTKEHDQNEYLEALKGWSKHEIGCVHIHQCLNFVLLHLDERWRGLHLLVLVFLRED